MECTSILLKEDNADLAYTFYLNFTENFLEGFRWKILVQLINKRSQANLHKKWICVSKTFVYHNFKEIKEECTNPASIQGQADGPPGSKCYQIY